MPKLLNKTNLPNYASAPLSPADGDVYYNTTDAKVYARINGAWVDLGAGGATVYYQTTAPSSANTGDIWIDSDDDTLTATGPQGPAGDPTLTIPTPYKTATYTFASGDESELIIFNSASTLVAQIPTDATFNFAIGTQINVCRYGAGALSVAAVTPATTTVRATPGANLRSQYSTATAIKIAANEWLVVGDLSA